jgi:hypothetical protein
VKEIAELQDCRIAERRERKATFANAASRLLSAILQSRNSAILQSCNPVMA